MSMVFAVYVTDPATDKRRCSGRWKTRAGAERNMCKWQRWNPYFHPEIVEEEAPAKQIKVNEAQFDAYQRAAEGFEQQAFRAGLLLREFWMQYLEGEIVLFGELRDGLEQYREQYGQNWPTEPPCG